MKKTLILVAILMLSPAINAFEKNHVDITQIMSKSEFIRYGNVAEFIDDSPKVTITVKAKKEDIEKYGPQVMKTLTGSDCDRDGKMDDNKTCNATYFKLWLAYQK